MERSEPISPTTASAKPSAGSPWLQAFRGSWLMLFGVLCYGASLDLGFRLARDHHFAADYPGDNPPWYFIRQDAIAGMVALGGLALSLAVAWFFRRRYPVYANMLAFLNVISMGGSAWKAIVILLTCPHVMDPSRATSPWPTFNSYSGDRVILGGQLAAFVVGLLIASRQSAWVRKAAGGPSLVAKTD